MIYSVSGSSYGMDMRHKELDKRIPTFSYRFERAGADYRPAGYESGWRTFPNTLITQIQDGPYLLETDRGGKTRIETETGFLIPPGVRSRVSLATRRPATTVYSHAHFLIHGAFGLFTVLDRPVTFDRATAVKVGRINRRLVKLQVGGSDRLAIGAEILDLGVRLLRTVLPHCGSRLEAWNDPARSRLLPVLQYIEENITRAIRREDLARVAGVSVPRFHVLFTRAFDRAPMDFVRDERMRRARRLLLWTDMPVAEIAWACGFADQYYFSRAFKAHEGSPPTTYRRVTRQRG